MAGYKKTVSSHGNSENEEKAWGRGEFANMPKDVKMKPYPKNKGYSDMGEDDTITRIDGEIGRMEGKARKNLSNQH
jgi:hypothetical protein